MSDVLRGVIHGNVIQLYGAAGVGDGAEVEVTVRIVAGGDPATPSQKIARLAGALADDAEWDRIMAEIQQSRKADQRPSWQAD